VRQRLPYIPAIRTVSIIRCDPAEWLQQQEGAIAIVSSEGPTWRRDGRARRETRDREGSVTLARGADFDAKRLQPPCNFSSRAKRSRVALARARLTPRARVLLIKRAQDLGGRFQPRVLSRCAIPAATAAGPPPAAAKAPRGGKVWTGWVGKPGTIIESPPLLEPLPKGWGCVSASCYGPPYERHCRGRGACVSASL
jgi:hypothetical protein